MPSEPIQRLLAKLPNAKRNGPGWSSPCPAHDDRRPSLSISQGEDGRALLHCHRGCPPEAIVGALGLSMRDLMPADNTDKTPHSNPGEAISSVSEPRTWPTAKQAVAALESQHGPRSGLWTYHNADGDPVGVVVRWDRPTGKDIRPVSRNSSGWVIGGMPVPRPLYRLPDLADAQRVYVVEGEKAADAAQSIGLIATTSPHGSSSAGQADWSILAGKDVVILPDHDGAGQHYVDDVIGCLGKLRPAPTVRVVQLPKLPPGGDIVDYIDGRDSVESADLSVAIKALADDSELVDLASQDTTLAPLVLRFLPFPVDALPEPARSFVVQGARAIGCDPSFIALPLLSAMASAIGNTRRVELKRGWTEPSIIWTVIVGDSGTLKSPALELALAPIHKRQHEAMTRYAEALELHQRELAEYERDMAAWRKSKASEPPKKPEEPHPEELWTSDATTEAVAAMLQHNPRGILLAPDELATWFGGFNRYAAGGMGADAARWIECFHGRALKINRKTGNPRIIYVPHAAVSVAGGIQPAILQRALGPEHLENGLAARLLLAMPPRRPKRWTEAEISPLAEAAIAAVFNQLYELQPHVGDDGEPRPVILTLTPLGKDAWVRFYNAHAAEQNELVGNLAAAWSKLEGYAARLALVVHLVRWAAGDPTLADPGRVDEVSIAAGVKLSRWFGHEARRVYAMLNGSDDDRERRQLVDMILAKGGSVTVRDWQRARSHKTSDDAEAELADLEAAAYGRWEVPPQTGPGRPSKVFVVNADRSDTDTNPAGVSESGVLSVSEASEDDRGE